MPDEKVLKKDVSALLSIDTGMVSWEDLDLGEGGGGGEGPGEGGGTGETATGQKKVVAHEFWALCESTDHDSATTTFGNVQASGMWIGTTSYGSAVGSDDEVRRHLEETGHNRVYSTVAIGHALAGPVTTLSVASDRLLVVAPAQLKIEEGDVIGGSPDVVVEPPPIPVEVAVWSATCVRTDHDPAIGFVTSSGTWLGPTYYADADPLAQQHAEGDAEAHRSATDHGGDTTASSYVAVFFPVPGG